MAKFSKSQIDRLGERLKSEAHTEEDLRLLNEYRKSFHESYRHVMVHIRETGHAPTGRSAKSTVSIVQKLRRESIRLSQMQDIAGCRVVVHDIKNQDTLTTQILNLLPHITVIDRRELPSHGYRAVHIIAEADRSPIEIQIRTRLQHLWAELSERFSDFVDPTIKYGGGPSVYREKLAICSNHVAYCEEMEPVRTDALLRSDELEADHKHIMEQLAKLDDKAVPSNDRSSMKNGLIDSLSNIKLGLEKVNKDFKNISNALQVMLQCFEQLMSDLEQLRSKLP